MTADWTTCLIVRDRRGRLWAPDAARGIEWWSMIGRIALVRSPAELDEDFGPLVPVLDADGLPAVQHLWNPMTNQTWCGAGERATESMAEARPRIPVCACCHIQAMHWRADHPVVRTVGDLTARHIGRRVRVDYGAGVTEDITIERVKHYDYGTNLGDDQGYVFPEVPCEVLP